MVAEAASGKSKHQELQAQAKAAAKARRAAELAASGGKEKKAHHHKPGDRGSKVSESTTAKGVEGELPAGDPPVQVLNEDTDHPTVKA